MRRTFWIMAALCGSFPMADGLFVGLSHIAAASEMFPEQKYLPNNSVAVASVRLRNVVESPLYRQAEGAGLLAESPLMNWPFLQNPAYIERLLIAVDQPVVDQWAQLAKLGGEVKKPDRTRDPLWGLLKVDLAMHNHASGWNSLLPRPDGDAEGKATGLSWRVHLLPLLDELELYKQFHFDEPWDSPHNKTLIPRMPKVFATAGVTEPGKTSMHLPVGEKLAFQNGMARGPSLRDDRDGHDSTIMIVVADQSLATEWTKPGGLPIDLDHVRQSLGGIPSEGRPIVMLSGRILKASPNIRDQDLVAFMTARGGEWLDFRGVYAPSNPLQPLPTFVATLKEPVAAHHMERSANEWTTINGETVYLKDGVGLWAPTPTTVVMGNYETLQSRLRTGTATTMTPHALVDRLSGTDDLSIAVDIKSQDALWVKMATFFPQADQLRKFESIVIDATLSRGTAGSSLARVELLTRQPEASAVATEELRKQLNIARAVVPGLIESAAGAPLVDFVVNSLKGVVVRQEGAHIVLTVLAPANIKTLPDLAQPLFEKLGRELFAKSERNSLKQIGLALHRYHDIHHRFPSNSQGPEVGDKGGLSWRVHLLPFLGRADLYNEFHLDEPWDSEHNLKLVQQMPEVFHSDLVADPTKTPFQVFMGEGTPLGGDEGLPLKALRDSTMHTILVVQAGADQATIWTKPGGLTYEKPNPAQGLGKVGDRGFLALLADGSVQRFSATLMAHELRFLIEHNNGW
ncbi:hypothetical protein Plim_0958 [Planctopirus limnophila DSM 3776]|uniref:DUF1559 domain-containing protein n=1 Tax=Planctopirus limnophila (strain ATCC 43296 / DSM 3776 / IFAM 1008 / Mu 290) TaxID=521674 RepID=D5ST34_PLAL2|nr:DUF1559 domain-containing protein [Planctopirus limnophila]ADG66802.1 hypothetical protein Plim_0958 [Planctopirus limnophila DSM 3776]